MIDRPLILLGAPGSGKGTLTKILARIWPVPVIATGDLLRSEAASNSSLGFRLRAEIASGHLVSEELVNQIVSNRLGGEDCRAGFILDGYPRSRSQAQYLDQIVRRLRMRMPPPAVIELLVPTSVVRERLTARLQCSTCGTVYNLRDHPPADADTCDHDGTILFRRSDDKDHAILNRLRIYEQMIGPLSDYCKTRWDYHRINGDQHPEMIAGLAQNIFLRQASSIRVGNHQSGAQCVLICGAQS